MKNKSRTILTAVAACLVSALLCQSIQAVPITGNITMAGSEALDTSSVNTATTVTAWGPSVVTSVNGFPGVALFAPVTLTSPWVFVPSGPHAALWSVGGYTFDLISDVVDQSKPNFLTIIGHGTISKAGFDTTDFDWNFSTQNPSAGSPPTFSFSAATQAVPDGGLTVAFLGFALVGVESLRRKLRK